MTNNLTFFTPLVFFANLFFLLGGEVILDVESFTNLFWGLALDHVSHSLAGQVQQRLNVQKVGGQNQLEQSSLVYRAKVFVPRTNVICSFFVLLIVALWRGVFSVVLAVLDDFTEDLGSYVVERNGKVRISNIWKGKKILRSKKTRDKAKR